MSPIRTVIVDDEKPARDRIRRLLADHSDIAVAGEAADVPTAIVLIERERPDLCFLDIQMPGGDAFDVLRKSAHLPRVIFTTAWEQYAVRAFEVHSLDYLLKPFDKRRFASALQRARDAFRQQAPPAADILPLLQEIRAGLQAPTRLLEEIRAGLPAAAPPPSAATASSVAPPPEALALSPTDPAPGAAVPPAEPGHPGRIAGKRGGKIVLLNPDEIYWFEAEDTLVFGRTREARYLVGKTLSELEEALEPAGFFRSHRRFLVNLGHIAEILPGHEGHYRIVLRDEAKSVVLLSRRQARRLRSRFPW